MGGKGKRRREKNFLAAHGGNSRLPPPPKLRELEAIPSKLRKLMQYKNNPVEGKKEFAAGTNFAEKKANPKDAQESKFGKENNIKKTSKEASKNDIVVHSGSDDTSKRKRKRKAVDLRFQDLDQVAVGSRKKERRKEFLEARKKKHKKSKADDALDFPGREEIKFGDIVVAPPKLSFPKTKASMDASQERIRLQAVEAYRMRRGLSSSRLGVKLPLVTETLSL